LRPAGVEYNSMIKIFLAIFILLAANNISYAQPAIYFEKSEDDLGTITQKDDRVEHFFEFENKGDEDLLIGSLVPS
jgi:hypothetical protein